MTFISKIKKTILRFLIIAFFMTMSFCGYKAVTILNQYRVDRENYRKLSQTYVRPVESPAYTENNDTGLPTDIQRGRAALTESSPIQIDFPLLQDQLNPETVAWLFCEDTQINYPVMYHQADNIYYLNHNSNGESTTCGAIYIDCANFPDFRDTNTIIHGHHLNDGSMFGSLGKWSDQEYFDVHRVFFLNTPSSNYKVSMIAYFETPAGSDAYQIDFAGEQDVRDWIAWIQHESTVESGYQYEPGDKFITMSTCMYSFENARGVLIGFLTPLEN